MTVGIVLGVEKLKSRIPQRISDEGVRMIIYRQARFIRFLDIGDDECVLSVLPRDSCMQEVGGCHGDVVHPHQHMEVQRPALLELEPVEVRSDVFLASREGISKVVALPPVVAPTRKIPAGYLFQNVATCSVSRAGMSVTSFRCCCRNSCINGGKGNVHKKGLTVTKNDGNPYWRTASKR